MTKKTNKFFVTLLLAALIVPLCLPIHPKAAAVPTDLKTSVSKVFSAMKQFDIDTIAKYCRDDVYDELNEDNYDNDNDDLLDADQVLKYLHSSAVAYAKKMTYKVSSYKVSGNSAIVTAKFKYVDASEHVEKAFDSLADTLPSNPTKKQITAFNKKFSSLIKAEISKAKSTDYKTKTLKLSFKKYGTTWKLVDFTDSLANVMYANMLVSLEDIEDALDDLMDDDD